MGESLSLAAAAIDGASPGWPPTSSHYCTAERQYRMPVPYGSQRTPHRPVDGHASGAVFGAQGGRPLISPFFHVTCGRIVDWGITDANNMGAAMAPAAYDTLRAHFTAADRHRPGGLRPHRHRRSGAAGSTDRHRPFRQDGEDMTKTTPTAGCCCTIWKSRICTPEAPAADAPPPCSTATCSGRPGRAAEACLLFAPTGALLSPPPPSSGESIPRHLSCGGTFRRKGSECKPWIT